MSRVQAAGGLVWRGERGTTVQVAVVHRPRYDDWSLPKGKAVDSEHPVQTALREVAEETGQRVVVGRPLGASRYDVLLDGEPVGKTVRWFAMEAVTDGPVAGEEVDQVRWLPPSAARDLLSEGRDVQVLDRFLDGPCAPDLVLLVRHAKAGQAVASRVEDDRRPLEDAGRAQAEQLAGVLSAFGPRRLLSAPVVRCQQTLQPLAELLAKPVEVAPVLGEEHHARYPNDAAGWLPSVAGRPSIVLCSQGGLIPDVLRALAPAVGEPRVAKASTWVLAFDRSRLLSADLL